MTGMRQQNQTYRKEKMSEFRLCKQLTWVPALFTNDIILSTDLV